MPNFGKLSLTSTGINTLVKAQAGSEIAFSKIKIGSGMFSGNVSTLTDLIETQLTAEIVTGTLLNNTYTVEAHFTNEGLAQGFYWREIGLYVNDSNGNDVLFGYANAGTSSDYIPATASEIYTKHVRISVAVGDAQNIIVNHTSGTYVDIVTFEEALNATVKKEDGKGLSTNDYTDAEKQKLADLERELEENYSALNQSIVTLRNSLSSYTTDTELEEVIRTFNADIDSAVNGINQTISLINKEIERVNTKIGTGNISSLGDGSITGAILKLYQMINSIPAITSGTSEPTGGKDGDVYIMHE
jgi:hypothetical protein